MICSPFAICSFRRTVLRNSRPCGRLFHITDSDPARRAMKRETVTAILLGLMAALPFGLLQHNWVLAICFGALVGFGMAPQAR